MIQNGEFHIGFRVLVKIVRLMASKTVNKLKKNKKNNKRDLLEVLG